MAEATSRPTRRFVTLKSEQLDMQTLYRVRARLAVALAELLDGEERVLAARITS